MKIQRIARHALLFFVGLLLLALPASAATQYYVDYARTSSGNGTAASPWKARTNINWTTIATALASGPVTIYFSSRATWNDNQELNVPASTNTTTNRLTFDGQSQYNTVTSGAASWQAETVLTNKATLTNAGGTGGSIIVLNTNAFMTIRGFRLTNPTWGGVNLGTANPTTNIHDILIENNIIDSPVNNHGVWFGYAETGCYNVTTRNNTISNTPLEGIYMGHFDYLPNTITGTVVEYNTLINTGTDAEGDIDIKAGNFGAIVRYNTMHTVSTGRVLAGIVVQASDVQVYGNALYDLEPRSASDGGSGIQINADGANGTGKTLNNVLVYNNLIYGNAQRGISMYATASGASITNAKFLNNTIVSNGDIGFHTSGSASHPITIAAFQNNILASNASYAMNISSGTSFTSLNYNLYWGTGTLLRYQGTAKTWAQWRALGFDSQGLNADPQLNGSYAPVVGSPVIDAGIVQSPLFSTDKNIRVRVAPWDIGAHEYGAVAPGPPSAPQNLRIVP